MISKEELKEIMPNIKKIDLYYDFLIAAMEEFEINTPLRISAFLAQIAHESGEFKWMEEIWGPTKYQIKYDPPCSKAKELGNTDIGDGKKYKGRGPIQLTGKANYKKYGNILNLDLVEYPENAATKEVAFRIAALYWKLNGLNELADDENFTKITKRINGGTLGLENRQKYYEKAKEILIKDTEEN